MKLRAIGWVLGALLWQQAGALQLEPIEGVFVAHRLAAGEQTIRLWLLSESGRSAQMAERLVGVSGQVLMLEEDVDLLYAAVPIPQLSQILSWSEWTAAELGFQSGSLAGLDAGEQPVAKKRKPGLAPSAYTPLDNPYTGASATQSCDFKSKYPTYDGRGVVIGGIEAVDARLPSLSYGFSLQGARVPKLIDYIMTPPVMPLLDPVPGKGQSDFGWQKTEVVSAGKDGHVHFNARRFALPDEARRTGAELRMAFVSRPERLRHSVGAHEFTLLWSVPMGRVWMYEHRRDDAGNEVIGTPIAFAKLPAQPHRPALAELSAGDTRTIMVAADVPTQSLLLNLGAMNHGTMCASVAAGHSFLNGRAEGVAPGAQWLPMYYRIPEGLEEHEVPQIKSLLTLYRDPRVEVLTNSTIMSMTRKWANESSLFYGQLLQRIHQRYPKPHFRAASNAGPAEDFFVEIAKAGSNLIAVGAYTPYETWKANFGIAPTRQHTPAPYSSYGPAYDGGLKPDLMALTGTFSAQIPEWPGDLDSPNFEMPHGYGISGGTSASTPNAAGHAALLISAAKQAGIPYDEERLKMALYASTKFLEGVEARVQGRGLIQVDAAWQALQKLKSHELSRFATEAPVRTPFSDQLTPAHVGRGLYERIGWSPGQKGRREITVTRTSGPSAPITYRLQWKGNDHGAFVTNLREVRLPLNVPTKIPVQISVGESGAYSAILDLLDTNLDLVAHSVMCTIDVAEPLVQSKGYTATMTRNVPRPGHGIVYVDVPKGATALRVEARQRGAHSMVLFAKVPSGLHYSGGISEDGEGGITGSPWRLAESELETYDQTFVNPEPGVWQFWMTHDGGLPPQTFDARETTPASSTEVSFKVTALGVSSISRPSSNASSSVALANGDIRATFTNQMGTIEQAQVKLMGVGAARDAEAVVDGSPRFFDVDVPAGATRLVAEANAENATSGTVGLGIFFVPKEPGKSVSRIAYEVQPGRSKRLEVAAPPAGRYRIAVDAWGADGQGLRVKYRDVVFHPLYGGDVEQEVPAVTLKQGERVESTLRPRIDAYPRDGRTLLAEVGLFGKPYGHMSLPRDYYARRFAAIVEGKEPPKVTVVTDPVPLAVHTVPLPLSQ